MEKAQLYKKNTSVILEILDDPKYRPEKYTKSKTVRRLDVHLTDNEREDILTGLRVWMATAKTMDDESKVDIKQLIRKIDNASFEEFIKTK